MTNEQVLEFFKKTGGYITDSHIVYTSGKHGSAYLNKDSIYPHTNLVSQLCRAIAEEFKGKEIEVIAAPALGGIILSQWTAHHLSLMEQREILAVYTEKTPDNGQVFTRGYDRCVKGKKVLIVEDILNTGGSVRKVVDAVRQAGGAVIAAAALVNRGNVQSADIGNVLLFTLASINLEAWEENKCPLCKQGTPINITVGKGKLLNKK
ncbi:MAG: phosphoribosyltransferase family protein [Patescibacteria group bacterium]